MPRERIEFFRESNTKEKEKIVVLAFEGNIAEEFYFEELKSHELFDEELIYVHILSRPKTDTRSAPNHVFSKLKREAKEQYNFGKADELWMIVDTDRWKSLPEMAVLCKAEGNISIAVSNPCFEFWLLLHVVKFSELTDDEKALILSNKKVSKGKNYIDKLLGDKLGDGYNKSNPRVKRFMEGLLQAVEEGEGLAIEGEDFPSNLGSDVYKVVKSIIKNAKHELMLPED